MILFSGTRTLGVKHFLVFTNESGESVSVPVDEQTKLMFLHHFHRLSPGIKPVENNPEEPSET